MNQQTNEYIEEKVREFDRYCHDTDWQEMHGGDLVDIDAVDWFRTALTETWNKARLDMDYYDECGHMPLLRPHQRRMRH